MTATSKTHFPNSVLPVMTAKAHLLKLAFLVLVAVAEVLFLLLVLLPVVAVAEVVLFLLLVLELELLLLQEILLTTVTKTHFPNSLQEVLELLLLTATKAHLLKLVLPVVAVAEVLFLFLVLELLLLTAATKTCLLNLLLSVVAVAKTKRHLLLAFFLFYYRAALVLAFAFACFLVLA